MTEPILLTEKKAREFLSGADPEKLCPPIRLGRGKYWSRAALDRAVKEKAGLAVDDGAQDAGSAYDAWKKDCA